MALGTCSTRGLGAGLGGAARPASPPALFSWNQRHTRAPLASPARRRARGQGGGELGARLTPARAATRPWHKAPLALGGAVKASGPQPPAPL
jgi:hypothetical protein